MGTQAKEFQALLDRVNRAVWSLSNAALHRAYRTKTEDAWIRELGFDQSSPKEEPSWEQKPVAGKPSETGS